MSWRSETWTMALLCLPGCECDGSCAPAEAWSLTSLAALDSGEEADQGERARCLPRARVAGG